MGRAPLATRPARPLSEAILLSTFPEIGTPAERAAFEAVAAQARLTRYGMDCYGYALLAAGQVDLVIEAGLHPYDVHAPIAVIAAAGGIVTDWQGGPAHGGGRVLAAANPAISAPDAPLKPQSGRLPAALTLWPRCRSNRQRGVPPPRPRAISAPLHHAARLGGSGPAVLSGAPGHGQVAVRVGPLPGTGPAPLGHAGFAPLSTTGAPRAVSRRWPGIRRRAAPPSTPGPATE
jgi:hypothetical protein